jgi:hypothetical protein
VAGGDAVKRQEEKSGMGRMGTAGEVADVVAFLFRFVVLPLMKVGMG